MTKKELINKLQGKTTLVDYDWLQEHDPELLEWVTSSKYWGRGFERDIPAQEAFVEVYFNEGGISYAATFKSHTDGVRQSLNNQPPWGEDSWDDWGVNQLKGYYLKDKSQQLQK